MIRKIICSLIILICTTALICAGVSADESDDVICDVSSLINGTYYQGADVSETALGDFVADAVCFASGADVALINAADLNAVIDAGPITLAGCEAVFTENRELAVATMSAEQIWDMLEYSISFIKIGPDEKTDREASSFEGFLQLSGIKYGFDASAAAGSRLYSLTIGDKQVNHHDPDTTFTVCATGFMLDGGYGFAACENEKLGMRLGDALAEYLKNGEYEASTISKGRVTVKGTLDRPLISRGMWLIIGVILCIGGFLFNKKKNKITPDRSLYSYIDPNR